VFPIPLDVSLGQSEVQDENFVTCFIQSDAEVIWFDISVNEMSVMDVLDSGDHLINQHKHGFEREFSESLVEKRFKGWAHQIHHKNIVVTYIKKSLPSVEQ
jgi:hypothetical protein